MQRLEEWSLWPFELQTAPCAMLAHIATRVHRTLSCACARGALFARVTSFTGGHGAREVAESHTMT